MSFLRRFGRRAPESTAEEMFLRRFGRRAPESTAEEMFLRRFGRRAPEGWFRPLDWRLSLGLGRGTPEARIVPRVSDPDPSADPTPPRRPRSTGPVQYRGADLEPARGPGLGCFRFQLIVLAVFVVLTPLSAAWHWPELVSGALLVAVIVLLLITGQTIIFLLRLVAADRRGRRRPLASETRTVGELEDAADAETGASAAAPDEASTDEPDTSDDTTRDAAEPRGPMRQ